jgi:hypothetical protein
MDAVNLRAWSRSAAVRLDALALASLSLGAAAIHFAVISEHFTEYALFGAFFAFIGWFQALWAVAFTIRPTRWFALLAIVANAATIGLWFWAHALGLPFGPEPGHVEPTTVTDLMATLFELVLVVWLIAVMGDASRPSRSSNQRSETPEIIVVAVVVGLIAAVAVGTTVAIAQPAM